MADQESDGEPAGTVDGGQISSGDTEHDGSESEKSDAGSGEARSVDPFGGIDPNDPATWPDNQLGAPAWMLPTLPPSPPEDLEPPQPMDSTSPQTHEEKMKMFWNRFVVPWPPPNQPEEEPMESYDGSDSDSDSISPPNGDDGGPHGNPPESMVDSPSDHVDSETLNLSDAGDIESALGSPPSAPESDEDSDMASESKFAEAMALGHEAPRRPLGSSSSKSTLETPKIARPSCYGYPDVESPPKVAVARHLLV